MSVEVGDLVEWQGVYAVVFSIDGDYVWGNWTGDPVSAKAVKPAAYACVDLKDCNVIEKRKRHVTSPPVSRGHCSCPWSMMTRGCACGAIKPYKLEIGQ